MEHSSCACVGRASARQPGGSHRHVGQHPAARHHAALGAQAAVLPPLDVWRVAGKEGPGKATDLSRQQSCKPVPVPPGQGQPRKGCPPWPVASTHTHGQILFFLSFTAPASLLANRQPPLLQPHYLCRQAVCCAGVNNPLSEQGRAAAAAQQLHPSCPAGAGPLPPFQVDMEFVALRTPLGRDFVPRGFLQASRRAAAGQALAGLQGNPAAAGALAWNEPAQLSAIPSTPDWEHAVMLHVLLSCCMWPPVLFRRPKRRRRRVGWAARTASASASTPPCQTR